MNALVLAFFAVVATVAAAPAAVDKPIEIISQVSEVHPDGTYESKYETANGIFAAETGSVKTDGKDVSSFVEGVYAYTAPGGEKVETKYYADATGFHAEGTHLPVGPETPEYILKSLAWSAAHPEEEEYELKKKL